MAAAHRLRQGIRALLAFTRPVDYDLASTYLNPEQLVLFRRMRTSEKLHSLNVLRDVLAQEAQTSHDLAVAALLHDVGKIRYVLRLWQKTLIVLARVFLPSLYRLWSEGTLENWWHRPFIVAEQHPVWGEELLMDTGASETVLWLVAHHADDAEQWKTHPNHAMLARLQRADDQN